MAPIVIIEVSGSASKNVPAERCTLSLSVTHQATDQTAVHDAVTNASNELSTYLNQMAPRDTSDDGHRGITKWSMGRLSTYSWERAIGTAGTQKERLHSARTTFSLTFRDFELMSKICVDVSVSVGLQIPYRTAYDSWLTRLIDERVLHDRSYELARYAGDSQ